MELEWDKNKRLINLNKHGLDFIDAWDIWDHPMIVREDKRYEYSEKRYIALGKLNNRIIVCAYTKREPNIIRIISFRKANKREVRRYEETIKQK